MTKLLVKFGSDYADEFQVSGFAVTTSKAWAQHESAARAGKWPQSRYFGTNEGIEWNSAEDYLSCFKVVEITDAEAKFLAKSFNGYGDQGHFLQVDDFTRSNGLY